VVGHSLGAGAAVLLAFLLRGQYPDLKCFTYGACLSLDWIVTLPLSLITSCVYACTLGTPGSVLDPKTADECSDFVTSCVLGHDMVCRLSFKALLNLRSEVPVHLRL
jgi:hypothetical protein